jgi:poly [ADP-ribose] polymerase
MELLDVLADLEVATKLLDETKKSGKNPLDAAYASLKCVLTPVPKDSPTFKRIQAYAANTHGSTHSGYSLEVLAVFEVDREGEAKRYEAYSSSIPNKQLLWHGSRTTNYMGILSQGLRIAPPEAPCTGYMFGKGVYFADSCSKSANYCHTSASSPEGLMLLCEAALGTTKDYCHAFYMDKPQPGTHSTKGVGKNEPKESEAQYVDGVKWPMGHMAPTPGDPKTTLLYHEYIVYDVAQCKMNYLLKVRFKYKK